MSAFDPIKRRIEIFESVRDQLYRIDHINPYNDRSCLTKPLQLQRRLREDADLYSRRIYAQFAWAAQSSVSTRSMPDARRYNLAPTTFYIFLEVYIPERAAWVKVDPSWDRGLKNSGLPIAAWDGLNDTCLGIKPSRVFDAIDSAEMLESFDSLPLKQRQEFGRVVEPFTRAFNAWLNLQRHSPGTLHA